MTVAPPVADGSQEMSTRPEAVFKVADTARGGLAAEGMEHIMVNSGIQLT